MRVIQFFAGVLLGFLLAFAIAMLLIAVHVEFAASRDAVPILALFIGALGGVLASWVVILAPWPWKTP